MKPFSFEACLRSLGVWLPKLNSCFRALRPKMSETLKFASQNLSQNSWNCSKNRFRVIRINFETDFSKVSLLIPIVRSSMQHNDTYKSSGWQWENVWVQYQGDSRPSDYECPLLTTRPGLPFMLNNCRCWFPPVWLDLAIFHHCGKILKDLAIIFSVHLVFGKILNLLCHFLILMGTFFVQYLAHFHWCKLPNIEQII